MNNRTRQWFKANAMMDKVDPQIVASSGVKCLIFRQSELETMREKYKDLKVICIAGKDVREASATPNGGDS